MFAMGVLVCPRSPLLLVEGRKGEGKHSSAPCKCRGRGSMEASARRRAQVWGGSKTDEEEESGDQESAGSRKPTW